MNWLALLAIIVCLLLMYAIGTIIISPFREENRDSFYDTFLCLIVGFIALATVYAIVKTGGNTIQLGFLALGFFYIVRNVLKKNIKRPVLKVSFAGVMTTCGIGLFFFIYYGLFYYNTPINNILNFDEYVYAFNGYNNQFYGVETSGIYLDGMSRATPYHYIEGWLCAFIANIFQLNYFETFSVCLRCVFSSIVVIGLISYARLYTDKLVVIFLACFTIFLSAVLLDYSPIRQNMAIGGNCKDLISGMFLIGYIISLKKDEVNYLWLLCLPIANVALTPVIMSSLFIFAFFQYFKKKDKKELFGNLLIIIVLSIFIASFYFMQHSTFPKKSTDSNIISTLFSSYSIKDFLYMAYRTSINYAMYLPYFIPLIILLIVKRKLLEFIKTHGQLIVLLIISAICGLLCHYMYYPIDNYDSGQLDTLVNMTIMDLMVLTSFLFVFSCFEHKISNSIIYVFMVIVSAYNVWVFTESIISRRTKTVDICDSAYRDGIKDYFSDHSISRIGVRLLSPDDNRYSDAYDLLCVSHLGVSIDGLAALNLSESNLSEEQAHWNSIIPQSNIFNGYLSQLESPYNLDSVQVEFIKRYNLDYIVVQSDYQLSDALTMLVDTTFVDGKIGERFMILKR